MRKFIAFIIFILGLALFSLGFLTEEFTCDKIADSCLLRSSIFGVESDSMRFKLSDLNDVTCEKRYQASRGSGKRIYYELTLHINNKNYVLETCPNLKFCRKHANQIQDYKYMEKGQFLNYHSSFGVSNVMGVIMGLALAVLGLKMFFDKTVSEDEGNEDD